MKSGPIEAHGVATRPARLLFASFAPAEGTETSYRRRAEVRFQEVPEVGVVQPHRRGHRRWVRLVELLEVDLADEHASLYSPLGSRPSKR